ncbi:MAG: hypothetical protein II161_06670, partial [Erysipelotrichaceae bacterium]|nr:hypothetical protein [Erysipelotrichaceae bacterium]
MYIDINDILKELYGTEMTEENLRRNGGAGIWDLYFDLAENHARHYRAFQRSVCSEDDRNLYFINELFLIPVCRQEKKREVMSREEGQVILSKVSQPLTANQYRETVGFLSEHRLSDDDIQILLDKQLQDRKKECSGNSLYAGRSVCRGRLAGLFSHWSEFICDHTALAMNVFNDITNAKAEMNRLFLKSMKSGFKEEVRISGSILWGSLTRNGRTVNSEGQESLNNEIWDKMQNEFSDSYLRDHFVREDIEGFWKEMAGYEPDDLLNNAIFALQLPFTAMNRESEHLLQLEDLFRHTALLKECFEKH